MYICRIYVIIPDFTDIEGFDWNFANVHKLLKRHNVTTVECEQAFFNEPFIVYDDPEHSIEEDRYYSLGVTNEYRHLTIIFTMRAHKIRPLSARPMTKSEVKYYEDIKKGS